MPRREGPNWDGRVSLNRYEQILSNYVETHPEEKRYWTAQVTDLAKRSTRREEAALRLNALLWEYFEERSRYQSPFREIVVAEGMGRISMLNLSEYWLRLWAPAPPSKKRE